MKGWSLWCCIRCHWVQYWNNRKRNF